MRAFTSGAETQPLSSVQAMKQFVRVDRLGDGARELAKICVGVLGGETEVGHGGSEDVDGRLLGNGAQPSNLSDPRAKSELSAR